MKEETKTSKRHCPVKSGPSPNSVKAERLRRKGLCVGAYKAYRRSLSDAHPSAISWARFLISMKFTPSSININCAIMASY